MPQSTVLSHLHPSNSCMSYQVVTPSREGSPYTSPTGTRLPLKNISSPSVVGSSSYMAGPLPLQLTNPLGYVGYSGSTADILIPKFITQRNSEHSPLHSSLSDLELPHTASSLHCIFVYYIKLHVTSLNLTTNSLKRRNHCFRCFSFFFYRIG
ncbi:unnamed protein product [Parnassius mnemosyne]|uniref:Uncharacterized protein n=1 Tax=Parnassius mnemosyne TaxID=213953 RepID=A0AAV1KDS0_9NEOP